MKKPIKITSNKHIRDKRCKKPSTITQTYQLIEFISKAKSIIKTSFKQSSNRSFVIITLSELKNNLNKEYKKRAKAKAIKIEKTKRLAKAMTLLNEYEAIIKEYNDILNG